MSRVHSSEWKWEASYRDDDIVCSIRQRIAVSKRNGTSLASLYEHKVMDINESGVRVDDTIEFAVRFSFGCCVLTGVMLGVITEAGVSVN